MPLENKVLPATRRAVRMSRERHRHSARQSRPSSPAPRHRQDRSQTRPTPRQREHQRAHKEIQSTTHGYDLRQLMPCRNRRSLEAHCRWHPCRMASAVPSGHTEKHANRGAHSRVRNPPCRLRSISAAAISAWALQFCRCSSATHHAHTSLPRSPSGSTPMSEAAPSAKIWDTMISSSEDTSPPVWTGKKVLGGNARVGRPRPHKKLVEILPARSARPQMPGLARRCGRSNRAPRSGGSGR